MIYSILTIAIAILCYLLYKSNLKLNKLTPLEYDFNTLKENYEELKTAYDTIYSKYYTLQEDCLDLEKKIDNLEEEKLDKEFREKLTIELNETKLYSDQKEQ